jgi:hypothetical protein
VFVIFRIFGPACKMPLVRVKTPPAARVMLLFMATPFALFIARFARSVTFAGIKTPDEVPPKTMEEETVAERFTGVPAIAGPFNVRVLLLTVKVPAVRVRVPPTVKSAPNVIFRLVLKLSNPPDIAFNVMSVPVPIVRLEVAPPVRVPPP